MDLPEKYTENLKELLKEDFPLYMQAMEQPPRKSIRINPMKISKEEFERISPFHLTPVAWCENGYYVSDEDDVSHHPWYYAGLYYIQEASAMTPASVLSVEEGDIVLDACCAPGGKSTALAAKLNGTGLLVSNDISVSRQNATLKNMERFGACESYIIAEDLNHLAKRFPETFDKILVDAPCSGEGMFRKEPSLINSWKEKDGSFYAPLQKEILNNAWTMLKPGGKMVYSTCTFAPCEDEEVIASLLETHPDAHVISSEKGKYFEPGINGLSECMRLYPHKIDGEGHFVCLLEKDGTSQKNAETVRPSMIINQSFQDFLKLIDDPKEYAYQLINDKVIRLPSVAFDNRSIRTVRGGLLMGTLKKDRFEPSNALAWALKAEQFENVLMMEPDDIRVEKYLRGETIRDESCRDGWVLVCVNRWPLGFAKCSGHMLKNKLEKGYRKL